jgi:hypothetical protein
MTIPGLGAKGATALIAAVGEDPRLFKNGRGLAAWLGWVPRPHSTGGRDRLLGISIPVSHYPVFHTVLRVGHDYLAPSSALSATG